MTPLRLITVLGTFVALSAGAAGLLFQLQREIGIPDDLINLPMLAVVGGALLVWLIWPATRSVPATRSAPLKSGVLAIFYAALVLAALYFAI